MTVEPVAFGGPASGLSRSTGPGRLITPRRVCLLPTGRHHLPAAVSADGHGLHVKAPERTSRRPSGRERADQVGHQARPLQWLEDAATRPAPAT